MTSLFSGFEKRKTQKIRGLVLSFFIEPKTDCVAIQWPEDRGRNRLIRRLFSPFVDDKRTATLTDNLFGRRPFHDDTHSLFILLLLLFFTIIKKDYRNDDDNHS